MYEVLTYSQLLSSQKVFPPSLMLVAWTALLNTQEEREPRNENGSVCIRNSRSLIPRSSTM